LLLYDGEQAIKGFLPIIDDLERMMQAAETANENGEESLADGVKMVSSKIEKYFESLDVKPFGAVGDVLDPDIHDAMMTKADKTRDDNVILDVFEKGFTYREKVIRHAKVIVNKK
jgi:molecular chaperone GrpE